MAPRAKKDTVAATAATETTQVKKTTVKKIEEVILQFGGRDANLSTLTADAKAAYKAAGNKAAVKTVRVYVKPEEGKAYYVVNDTFSGEIVL